jgi:hypothetical protein
MKKLFITAAFLTFSFLGYSQTYTKKVINGDSVLIRVKTETKTDTLKRSDLREQLEKINQSIKNNQESRKIQNAEFDRLEAYYIAEKLRLKSELVK